jgi:hypothetical protein
MASVLDQLPKSNYSLLGNKFNPKTNSSDWGYAYSPTSLNPQASLLHNIYSIYGTDPKVAEGSGATFRIFDYNRAALGGVTAVRPPSQLDELDAQAPKLTPGGVVSQMYKSPAGQRYRDLGPSEGRY